jgi:hypothetical protein
MIAKAGETRQRDVRSLRKTTGISTLTDWLQIGVLRGFATELRSSLVSETVSQLSNDFTLFEGSETSRDH